MMLPVYLGHTNDMVGSVIDFACPAMLNLSRHRFTTSLLTITTENYRQEN